MVLLFRHRAYLLCAVSNSREKKSFRSIPTHLLLHTWHIQSKPLHVVQFFLAESTHPDWPGCEAKQSHVEQSRLEAQENLSSIHPAVQDCCGHSLCWIHRIWLHTDKTQHLPSRNSRGAEANKKIADCSGVCDLCCNTML